MKPKNLTNPDQNFDYERKNNPQRNVAVVGLRDSQNRVLLVRTAKLPGRWQPVGGNRRRGISNGSGDSRNFRRNKYFIS